MSKTIYLYLKTHNQTGLKYLGKTTKDPFQYHGSGVYWKNHLRKHGYDITTEILFQTKDKKEFEKVSLEYSEKWDISNNNEFANLIEERGQGGLTTNQFFKGHKPWNKGKSGVQDLINLQKARKKYQEEWHLHNVKKIRVGTWSPPVDNVSSLNKKIIECPHCNKVGNYGNMKRWHFENCKWK